jgi:hypothetical protein
MMATHSMIFMKDRLMTGVSTSSGILLVDRFIEY